MYNIDLSILLLPLMAEAGSFADCVKKQAEIVRLTFRGIRLQSFFTDVSIIMLNGCLVFLLLRVPPVSRAKNRGGSLHPRGLFPFRMANSSR